MASTAGSSGSDGAGSTASGGAGPARGHNTLKRDISNLVEQLHLAGNGGSEQGSEAGGGAAHPDAAAAAAAGRAVEELRALDDPDMPALELPADGGRPRGRHRRTGSSSVSVAGSGGAVLHDVSELREEIERIQDAVLEYQGKYIAIRREYHRLLRTLENDDAAAGDVGALSLGTADREEEARVDAFLARVGAPRSRQQYANDPDREAALAGLVAAHHAAVRALPALAAGSTLRDAAAAAGLCESGVAAAGPAAAEAIDGVYEAVVTRGTGAHPHELAVLLAWVLRRLRFDAEVVPASLPGAGGSAGDGFCDEPGASAVLVRHEGRLLLADPAAPHLVSLEHTRPQDGGAELQRRHGRYYLYTAGGAAPWLRLHPHDERWNADAAADAVAAAARGDARGSAPARRRPEVGFARVATAAAALAVLVAFWKR